MKQVTILTPKLVTPSDLEPVRTDSKFVMRGTLSKGAEFLGLLQVPTIIDMIGFSGGGPPGFSYAEPVSEDKEDYLFILVAPNLPIHDNSEVLGVCSVMGMIFGASVLRGSKEHIDGVISDCRKETEILVLDMLVYEHPEMLKQAAFPRVGV